MTGEETDPETDEPSTPEVPTAENIRKTTESSGNEGQSSDDETGLLATLDSLEGWHVEGEAARVHYSGETDRYSIEYYSPSNCTLYWKVPPDDAGSTAVPVGRDTVPAPLRERIREDLASAGIDPSIDERHL
jgi:hypothetical protein